MSRIGKKPVIIPQGVDVTINGHVVTVKGKLGTLKRELCPEVAIAKEKDHLICSIPENSEKAVRAKFGLVRSLLQNMVTGCHTGFNKELEIVGVGYKAKSEGAHKVTLNVGYSHSVDFESPKEVTLKVEGQNKIVVSGPDKEIVGQVAADIRNIRPPEHYKGTGIKYAGEVVRIKEGKKLAA
ncbi:MAG TPA: 50S ribosomal protein L6 [Candidatus Ozemobacteraceae bacterium]|nr:50S ribosomal protein L6 [Candidatus Ozemobacteraceae bacterium]